MVQIPIRLNLPPIHQGGGEHMNAKYAKYQELEMIPQSSIQTYQSSPVLTWIKHIWRRLKTPSPHTSVPFVWKTTDISGTIRWNTFDPLTGQTSLLMSDDEFYQWLTCRYYQ